MTALGEMAAWIPHSSGFAGYATRFCDPALGFALGWTYWCKYIITTPNQLTASALIIQEWKSKEQVNPGVWVTIFLVAIICINYFGIKFFGELEFWLSSIKVVTIVSSVKFKVTWSELTAWSGRCHLPLLPSRSWCRSWSRNWLQILQEAWRFQGIHRYWRCRKVLRVLVFSGQRRFRLPRYRADWCHRWRSSEPP